MLAMKQIFNFLIVALILVQLVAGFQQGSKANAVNEGKKIALNASTNKRQSWEFGRFLKTAAFYDALTPKLPFPFRSEKTTEKVMPKAVLWSKAKPNPNIEWGPLDDVVMGGVSKSDLTFNKRFDGDWSGIVSTSNNGGFVGIRTKLFNPTFDLSGCTGIVLKVKGDGNRYKFIVRDDDDWNGTAWSFSFDTVKNKIVTVKIPFKDLKPTKFARVIQGFRSYDSSNFKAMQLSLSKFEYDGGLNPKFTEGSFSLSVESIETY